MANNVNFGCMHPVTIQMVSGKVMRVPCGKCPHCLLMKSNELTQRCEFEASLHKYCVFCTLTFDNECLPRCRFEHTPDGLFAVTCGNDAISLPDGERYCRVPEDFDTSRVVGRVQLDGKTFGFAPRFIIQRFMKRLRKHFSLIDDFPVRSFYCMEYGPTKLRPHYHLLLFGDSPKFSESVAECVSSSWPFGYADVQPVQSSASRYVAGYVCGFGSLPSLFTFKEFRPYSRGSNFLGSGLECSLSSSVLENEVDDFTTISGQFNGDYVERSVFRSFQRSIFPKVPYFTQLDIHSLSSSYSIVLPLKRFFKDLSLYEISDAVCSVLELNANGDIPCSFTYQNRFYFVTKSVHQVLEHIKMVYASMGRKSCLGFSVSRDSLYHWLLISRKVCVAFKSSCLRLKYLVFLRDFYSRLKLLQLRSFYQLQVDYINELSECIGVVAASRKCLLFYDFDYNIMSSPNRLPSYSSRLSDLPPALVSFLRNTLAFSVDAYQPELPSDCDFSFGCSEFKEYCSQRESFFKSRDKFKKINESKGILSKHTNLPSSVRRYRKLHNKLIRVL